MTKYSLYINIGDSSKRIAHYAFRKENAMAKSRMLRLKRQKKNIGDGWAGKQASKRSRKRPRRRSFLSNFRSVGYKAK